MTATTENLRELLEAASPGPWHWVNTPSAHTLDYPLDAPDEEWDGRDAENDHALIFDKLRGKETVLGGVWCNDSTAEVAVDQGAADAKLIALAPDLACLVVTLTEALSGVHAYAKEIQRGTDSVAQGDAHGCAKNIEEDVLAALATVEELGL